MLGYIKAKAVEYAETLLWVDQELQRFDLGRARHAPLLDRLRGVVKDARINLDRLEAIVRIFDCAKTESGRWGLVKRAVVIIHDLEFSMAILSYHYLPALRKEDVAELALRGLVLSTARRCGLKWVDDLVIRLDGGHAIFPYLPEAPVLSAPPQQATSFIDMSGVYHELGHDVFQKFPTIAEALHREAVDYFNEFRRNVGPMMPDKRAERDRQIDRALAYWHTMRLNEIFSDIFGTFLCGPAYYALCVDLAMKMNNDLFDIDYEDEHPPIGARVYACYGTLSDSQKRQRPLCSIHQVWKTYSREQSRSAEYELICAGPLLDRLVETSTASIRQCLPEVKEFNNDSPERSIRRNVSPDDSLETILNLAIGILHSDSEHYSAWEREAFGSYLLYFSDKLKSGEHTE